MGRFHSIDPLVEQRNWLTQYNYCQNNPIARIDPDGKLDDWWVNEESGSLIHTQGNAEPIDKSENVSHLGEDGMFGEEGKKIENQNYESGEGGELHVSPECSKKIAESADYKVVPVEVEIVDNTKTSKSSSNSTTYGEVLEFETKVSYVPVAHEETGRSAPEYISGPIYKNVPFSSSSSVPTVTREQIYYGKKSGGSKVGRFINNLVQIVGGGNHDYTDPVVVKHPLRN